MLYSVRSLIARRREGLPPCHFSSLPRGRNSIHRWSVSSVATPFSGSSPEWQTMGNSSTKSV